MTTERITLSLEVEEADNHTAVAKYVEDETKSAKLSCSCGWTGKQVYTDPGDLEVLFRHPTPDLQDRVYREWTLHVYKRIALAWGLPIAEGTRTEVALPAIEWAALLEVLAQANDAGLDEAARLHGLIRDYFGD
ncbi:hypothetical protein [Glycomyces sp. MUSA5-2]|uniref:hypothetical protein n=1 Tax=Glycomyces sp. MUSA5-2 TaxID=2053002 RepID=UPI003008485E